MEKKQSRLRRARKTRAHIKRLGLPRLTVHRSGRHIYAQVIAPDGEHVLASASTLQKAVRDGLKGTSNKDAASAVGKAVGVNGGNIGLAPAFEHGNGVGI